MEGRDCKRIYGWLYKGRNSENGKQRSVCSTRR